MNTVLLVLAWLAAAGMAAPVAAMLAPRLTVANYRGEPVVAAVGLVLLPAVAGPMALATVLGAADYLYLLRLLLWLSGVALAGFLDDAAGDSQHRGVRGHIGALLGGRLTTGMAKVIISAAAALSTFALPGNGLPLVRLAVLLLAVNLFNQLDLRPGRALKVFVLVSAPFMRASASLLAATAVGAALGLLPGDLRSRHMLGDTGANLLGALAGVMLVDSLGTSGVLISAVVLLAGNLAGEFLSFNRLVGANRLLAYLDGIGRPRQENPLRQRNK